jgi:hypothetical protein
MSQQQTIVDKLVDAAEQEICDKISVAEDVNKKVRENAQRATLAGEISTLEIEAEKVEKQMKAIADSQQKALEDAHWPVEGLGMDDEGVLYNGLPIEQSSKSVRTRVSVEIGMALNPRLRLLVCQDGGDLDNDALDALDAVLAEKDFQMILELVTRGKDDEARCAVIVENGKVKAAV